MSLHHVPNAKQLELLQELRQRLIGAQRDLSRLLDAYLERGYDRAELFAVNVQQDLAALRQVVDQVVPYAFTPEKEASRERGLSRDRTLASRSDRGAEGGAPEGATGAGRGGGEAVEPRSPVGGPAAASGEETPEVHPAPAKKARKS